VPANLGGVTFLRGNPNVLLIGGAANNPASAVYRIGVTRDVQGNITGWNGPATLFSTAPNIDGGLTYNLDGVLFFTGYPNNTLGYMRPGSVVPDRIINLSALTPNSIASSVGTLQFVPPGFLGAGNLIVGSYSASTWYKVTLNTDAPLSYIVESVVNGPSTGGGPEGLVYIPTNNPLFCTQSVLVSEYSAGAVRSYQIDSNGFPIPSTRRDFITGLSGAEGAVLDPITGQFIFSTFGGGNRVIVVRGFAARPPCIPDVAGVGGSVGGDGQLTVEDLTVFLNAFFQGNGAIADIATLGGAANPDGRITADDLILFLGKFFEGCPLVTCNP
jgi:hypothetical protein